LRTSVAVMVGVEALAMVVSKHAKQRLRYLTTALEVFSYTFILSGWPNNLTINWCIFNTFNYHCRQSC